MHMTFREITRITDVPPFVVVLSRHKGEMPATHAEAKTQCAVIAQSENGNPNYDWNAVVAGRMRMEVFIVCTPEFRQKYPRAFMDIVERVSHVRGLDLNPEVILAPIGIVESIRMRRINNVDVDDSGRSGVQEEFDAIGEHALNHDVSDIHIEIRADGAEVKVRRHGYLMHHRYNSRDSALRMVRTAYSTLADPDSRADAFSEREYQNAMIERDYDRGRVRFRWASLPIFPDGCEVVLRLIPVGVKETHKTFEELGYDRHHEDMIRRIFARSVGITIIAGTTGSGKSTTLKHAIEGIASERKGTKIRTIEEPCEFVISGASQTPVVRPKDENTKKNPFVDAIKACMRADPDILMIGEIRDIETARLAIQAVRSGHQAMSTIHADSALTVVDRMVGMGIERDAIGSVGLISGLIYQKLVQVLCPKCRVPARKHAEERPNGTVERLLHMYGGDLPVSMYFKNPEGCPHCNGTGIVGRTVCAEVIRPTIEMTDCFRSGDSIGAYKLWRQDVAHANPFSVAGRSAFEHALIKAHQGICSPEDVEHAFEWLDDPQAMAWATPIREHAQSRRSSDERTARRNREGQAV